jgi:hypothetical protein
MKIVGSKNIGLDRIEMGLQNINWTDIIGVRIFVRFFLRAII